MRYSQLPPRLRTYIMASAVSAALATGVSTWGHPVRDWELFLGLLALAGLAGAMKVELPVRWGRMSLGSAVTFFALFSLGIPEAIAVNAVSAIASSCFKRLEGITKFDLTGIPPYRILFNLANHTLCAAAAGWAFEGSCWSMHGAGGSPDISHRVGPVVVAGATYYLVNTMGTAAAVAWSQGLRVSHVWKQNFLWTAPSYFAAASGATALAWLYQTWGFNAPLALLLTPPFYLIYHSYRLYTEKIHQDKVHLTELNELNHSVITSLAMAIDAKDRYTHKHINQVREYAIGLAERLGLSAEEVEAVKIAALLRGIGQRGGPDNSRKKP